MVNMKKIDTTTAAWFNREEWLTVYYLIYSEAPQFEKAIDILKMWKMRHPSTPAGVEGTFIILQTLHKPTNTIDDYDLNVLYSTAIMRFLNICAAHDTKQGTFSRNVKIAKIPQWIVDMRHDIAHGTNLPPFHSLKQACEFAFNWLYENYWHPVSRVLSDYTPTEETVTEIHLNQSSYNLDELLFLMNTFECLVVFQHPKFNLKTIHDISDAECKDKLLNDLKNFRTISDITEDTYLSALSKSVISAFHGFLSMANVDTKEHIVKELLSGIAFLCDEDMQAQLFGGKSLKFLPWKYVSLWVELLQVFYKFSMIEMLLKNLFTLISSEEETHHRKKMASLWIIEIVKGLKKVQLSQIVAESEEVQEQVKAYRSECMKYVVQKTESAHPALKKFVTFDPFIEVPPMFKDLKTISQLVLKDPNEYAKPCLPFVLELISPTMDTNLSTKLKQLVKNFIHPEKISSENYTNDDKVYSVEDIKKELAANTSFAKCEIDNLRSSDEEDILETKEPEEMETNVEEVDENNHWKLASEHLDFQNCPFGLLPWQDKTNNPLLQSFLELN